MIDWSHGGARSPERVHDGISQVGNNLCLSASGTNPNYVFLMEPCDTTGTNTAQIFTAMCPPSPPPPVAAASPPCGGGPVMVQQTINGNTQCMTAPNGYNLNLETCNTSPSQARRQKQLVTEFSRPPADWMNE